MPSFSIDEVKTSNENKTHDEMHKTVCHAFTIVLRIQSRLILLNIIFSLKKKKSLKRSQKSNH